MCTYRFGDVLVEVGDGYTVTRFPDGAEIHAAHAEQLGQQATAEAHGLDVQTMNEGHDLMHSVLAAMVGHRWSPALHAAATGQDIDPTLAGREEQAVLSLQGWLHAAGVSVEQMARRVRALD